MLFILCKDFGAAQKICFSKNNIFIKQHYREMDSVFGCMTLPQFAQGSGYRELEPCVPESSRETNDKTSRCLPVYNRWKKRDAGFRDAPDPLGLDARTWILCANTGT
jgi:hypothetical protein